VREEEPMPLKNAKIGSIYTVKSISLDRAVMGRLEALGLTKETTIRILNRNRTGAVILLVRGSRLALGGKITEAIYIKEAIR
jgi:ferrous iron transport protein A